MSSRQTKFRGTSRWLCIVFLAATIAGSLWGIPSAQAAILDTVSGASHAYGLRQLTTAYAGPLVRIQRTDGGQADVSADSQGNSSPSSPITVTSGSSTSTVLSAFVTGTN